VIAAAAPRKHIRLLGKHAWFSVLGGLVMALAMAGVVDAYWTASGTGGGSGPVGTLGAPSISSATPGAGTATLTWTAVTPPRSGTVSYYVNGAHVGGNCPMSQAAATTATSCADSGLSPNTYSYTVTAVWQSWTATSAPAAVTLIPPPGNTVPPVISGTAMQGQTLSSTTGTWTNSPTGYTYQWRRCDSAGNNCSNISGATSSTYVLQSGDVGSTIRVVVTATNSGGSTPATSDRYPSSGTVLNLAPVNTALPVISGTALQGQTLSTTNGSWTQSPTSYAYQWRRCDLAGSNCVDISSATSGTYVLQSGDVGSTVRVVVTAGNSYGSASATSAQYPASGTVQSAVPANMVLPVISGTATQDQVLSTTNGTWTNSPTGYSYQWQRCDSAGNNCVAILGATASTYTLVYADAGSTLRVVVNATNSYGSTPAISARYPASGTVLGLAPVNTVLPLISGAAEGGQTISTTTGSWDNSPTLYAYQWQRCNSSGNSCSNIGANASTYSVLAGDVGSTILVVVTATNPYGSTPAASDLTAVVVPAGTLVPVNTVLPVISGTAAVGQTLSTTNGSWTNSPTGYSYQWRSCNPAGNGCSNIAGATASTYVVASADSKNTLRVVVTATNSSSPVVGGLVVGVSATSGHTGKVP
jgi:hypothetical protein